MAAGQVRSSVPESRSNGANDMIVGATSKGVMTGGKD